MRRSCRWFSALFFSALLVPSTLAFAVEANFKDFENARTWAAAIYGGKTVPFSFSYDSQPSSEILKDWKIAVSKCSLDENRIRRVLTYSDPNTDLVIRYELTEYRDFPTLEWVVWIENHGKKDSPILDNVLSADFNLSRSEKSSEYLLHYSVGANSGPSDYAPAEKTLGPKSTEAFAPHGGRPTNGAWPYSPIKKLGYITS